MAKNNTLNLDVGINLAKSRLPEARKNPSIEAMTKCKDSGKILKLVFLSYNQIVLFV